MLCSGWFPSSWLRFPFSSSLSVSLLSGARCAGHLGCGLGGGGVFGWVSLLMCHSHKFLSSTMCNQLWRLPLAFGFRTVIVFPVVLHLVVIVSVFSCGRSAFKVLTIAFLLVERTPDFGLGFLTRAVMRSFGGWMSGARATLPRDVMDRALSIDLASGMS